MKFGFHLSIAGGLIKAAKEAQKLGIKCLQIFAGNPRSWSQRPLLSKEAAGFRRASKEAGLELVVVHAPYLLNLASPDPKLWQRSQRALRQQLKRARLIGAQAVVVHPGSRGPNSVAWGIERVAQAVEWSLAGPGLGPVECWLENTAGGGNLLGGPLNHLNRLMKRLQGVPVGVCLDTAHAWGAGYKLDDTRSALLYLIQVRKNLGIRRVKLWHLNDSIQPLDSGKDQHAHLGKGLIGVEGLKGIICSRHLQKAFAVMETPKDSRWADRRNLAFVRRLAALSCKSAQ